MIKKTLLVTAVGSLAIAGKMAPVTNTVDVQAPNSDATISEPELTADCPWCWPTPECFPGDPCGACA